MAPDRRPCGRSAVSGLAGAGDLEVCGQGVAVAGEELDASSHPIAFELEDSDHLGARFGGAVDHLRVIETGKDTDATTFREAMRSLGKIRRRDGALHWGSSSTDQTAPACRKLPRDIVGRIRTAPRPRHRFRRPCPSRTDAQRRRSARGPPLPRPSPLASQIAVSARRHHQGETCTQLLPASAWACRKNASRTTHSSSRHNPTPSSPAETHVADVTAGVVDAVDDELVRQLTEGLGSRVVGGLLQKLTKSEMESRPGPPRSGSPLGRDQHDDLTPGTR